jgi:hypothetical protein
MGHLADSKFKIQDKIPGARASLQDSNFKIQDKIPS